MQAPVGSAEFDSLVDDWLLDLAEQGLAEKTIANYLAAVRDMRAWLVSHGLGLVPQDIADAALRGWLMDPAVRRTRGTRRALWTAARSFWGWVHDLDVIPTNPMDDVEAPVGTHLTPGGIDLSRAAG